MTEELKDPYVWVIYKLSYKRNIFFNVIKF